MKFYCNKKKKEKYFGRDCEQTAVDLKKVRYLPEIVCYCNHFKILTKGFGTLLSDNSLPKELGRESHKQKK